MASHVDDGITFNSIIITMYYVVWVLFLAFNEEPWIQKVDSSLISIKECIDINSFLSI